MFFDKINKIGKPLARIVKKKSKRAQINKIRNEKGEITVDITEIQWGFLRKEFNMRHLHLPNMRNVGDNNKGGIYMYIYIYMYF